VLIKGLPAESATCRDGDPWTQLDHTAVALLEHLSLWGRIHAQLLGGKSYQLPKQIQIDRPKPPARRKVETDPRRIAAFFSQHFK
jgi:hypothetical protein